MTRGNLRAAVWVAALAVGAASPAWAQRGSAERADPDSRTTAGTGSAVDRSSGSSTPSSSGSGSSSSSTSSSGSGSGGSASSAPSASSPSSSSTADYVSVPVRPNQTERGQRARGGNGGESRGDGGSARAVPRDSDRAAGSTSSVEGRASGASAEGSAPSRRAVPTYSRPRDGNGTGTAVDRRYPPYGSGSGNTATYYYSYPGYYYGRYYSPGYAFGLGYLYDPGWYDPYYYGGAYGGGYGGAYGGGYGGGYAGGGYQGGYGSSSYGRGPTGSLRLKIEPKQAQVYVDGYFVGVVDSFDGIFQKLAVDAGGHRIEIKAPGFETISFDVLITPNETVTYKGELRRIP